MHLEIKVEIQERERKGGRESEREEEDIYTVEFCDWSLGECTGGHSAHAN